MKQTGISGRQQRFHHPSRMRERLLKRNGAWGAETIDAWHERNTESVEAAIIWVCGLRELTVKYFALWTKHETQDFSWHSRSHWTVAIMVRQNLKLFMLSSAGSQGRNINNLMFVSVASQPGIHLLSQFFSLDSLHTQRVPQHQVVDLELNVYTFYIYKVTLNSVF